MTLLFGYCLGPPGYEDGKHDYCPGEVVDRNGVRLVCGCPRHEREAD